MQNSVSKKERILFSECQGRSLLEDKSLAMFLSQKNIPIVEMSTDQKFNEKFRDEFFFGWKFELKKDYFLLESISGDEIELQYPGYF